MIKLLIYESYIGSEQISQYKYLYQKILLYLFQFLSNEINKTVEKIMKCSQLTMVVLKLGF